MYRILLVEDNIFFRPTLLQILQRRFPQIVFHETKNGREYIRRQPMKEYSFPLLTFSFALVLACLFSGACTRQDSNNPAKPEAITASAIAVPVEKIRQPKDMQTETATDNADLARKIRQWEAVQESALENYDACLEICGNSDVCLDNCEQAYVLRLATEYKILLHE